MFIADDSPAVRHRLVALVDELCGARVVGQAGTVLEAICGIRKLAPDVAIVDLHLPDGSGLDVVDAIKQGLTAPVVVVATNDPHPGYRERCLAAGADFFLDKSIEFDRIAGILQGLRRGATSSQAPRPSPQT